MIALQNFQPCRICVGSAQNNRNLQNLYVTKNQGNLASVFVDQSFWENAVSVRPTQCAWAFLTAGLVWYAIPFAFGTAMGLALISLNAKEGGPLLSDDQVNLGQ